MAYRPLEEQICERFASLDDLRKCTIEEAEEYIQHIERDFAVYADVDYQKILKEVEKEFDIILWDGGNNDTPFFRPDLHIVVADPLRAGEELAYYPTMVNLKLADAVVINKADEAKAKNVELVEKNVKSLNKKAIIVKTASTLSVDNPKSIRNKKVLCVEDAPTVTHA